jgi:hypothetical protein
VAYLQANAEEIWLELDSKAKRLALENPRNLGMPILYGSGGK